jgi:putative addiction module component (TIGR02574 family)
MRARWRQLAGTGCACASVVSAAGPGFSFLWLRSKRVPLVMIAHRMRAFLFASATTAFCQPERVFSANTQRLIGSVRVCAVFTTDFAPWISNVRTYVSPCLVIVPQVRLVARRMLLGHQPQPRARDDPALRDYTSTTDSLECSMPTSVEELVEQASKLSAEDRTHLADLLLASVPDDESAEVDASWDIEIRRRVDAVRAGTAQTVSAEDVHAQARRLYQR